MKARRTRRQLPSLVLPPSSLRNARSRLSPLGRGGASLRSALREPAFDRRPVNVREERLDVLRTLGGLVVEKKRVLPNVHHKRRREARDVADLVQRYPVV